MQDQVNVFTALRKMAGGKILQSQVEGANEILSAAQGLPIPHIAYLLATAWHETASTMQPIAEYGKGRGKAYGKPGKYGQAQYGRGYVQLTWDDNYEKADKALGLNGALMKDFNLAMQPTIAAQILVRGCEEGWFTGKKLSDYLPDYVGARRVVNGTDKAQLIAGYAREFEAALRAAETLASLPPKQPATATQPAQAPTATETPQSLWAWLLAALAGLFKPKGPKA